MFTQPLMYKAIKQHKSAHQQYVEKLIAEGSVSKDEIKAIHDNIQRLLNAEFDGAKEYKPSAKDWLASHWSGFKSPAQLSRIRNTGVKSDILRSVGAAITALPPSLTPHRQIKKVYETRRAMIDSGAACMGGVGMHACMPWEEGGYALALSSACPCITVRPTGDQVHPSISSLCVNGHQPLQASGTAGGRRAKHTDAWMFTAGGRCVCVQARAWTGRWRRRWPLARCWWRATTCA